MSNENLFGAFDALSSKQWKQQIQYDLKGADYNETLVWESPEGIKTKPFYHPDEDAANTGAPTAPNAFAISQEIYVFDLDKSIYRANDSLRRGAENIRFRIDHPTVEVVKLLQGIQEPCHSVSLQLQFLPTDQLASWDAAAAQLPFPVYVMVDPIAYLSREGNWMEGGDNFELVLQGLQKSQHLHLFHLDLTNYQQAGATITQQLSIGLAQLHEYLQRGFTGDCTVHFAIGSNYFFEIAKLRAWRMLVQSLADLYQWNGQIRIFATPSFRNKTLYDYNVNMLRTTTECMSAILGGADIVGNLPYDAHFHKSNEFAERISRNQLLILKHESHFDKVANPAEGSYYIENLTQQLAQKALDAFKKIEEQGGLLAALKAGTIQNQIKAEAQKEEQAVAEKSRVLIGTNKYPNAQDRMSEDLALFPFVKHKPRKTLIRPLIAKRLAEDLEKERLEQEKAWEKTYPIYN